MKFSKPFFYLFLVFSLLGCEELEEFLEGEIDVPITFVLNMDIIVDEDLDPIPDNTFQALASYDVFSNPDVVDAVGTPEQVKKIRITNLEYSYKNFSGNVDAELSGEMTITAGQSTLPNLLLLTPVNAAQASLSSERFPVQGNFGDNLTLSGNKSVIASLNGMSSENPVLCTAEVLVSAMVTVEINRDDL